MPFKKDNFRQIALWVFGLQASVHCPMKPSGTHAMIPGMFFSVYLLVSSHD